MKLNRATMAKGVFATCVAGACLIGAHTVATPAEAGLSPWPWDCNCPAVYDPVLCPNGRIYGNACEASCFGQFGCIPLGGEPM